MLYFEEVESSLMIVEVKSRSNISRIKLALGTVSLSQDKQVAIPIGLAV